MNRQHGSSSVELVLVTPAMIVMLLFVVFAGRVTQAEGEVEAAARDAARAASMSRSPSAAEAEGSRAAARALRAGDVTCRHLDVAVDTNNFRAGGDVAATVTCVVDFADLALLAVPSSRPLSASFRHPIDTFRGTSS